MTFGTATLLALVLLASAASLASYLLSQWRNNGGAVAWLGIGIGTTLLVAAAGIAVLFIGWLPTLGLFGNDDLPEQLIKPAQSEGRVSQRESSDEAAPPQSSQATISETAAQADRSLSRATAGVVDERASQHRNEFEIPPPPAASLQSHKEEARAKAHTAATIGGGAASADPWAATTCVASFHPDPADLTRWSLDNGCGSAVGLVVATCAADPPECGERQATWKYQAGGMLLPGKAQRSVTGAEQTQYGQQIRYVSCLVTTPDAIRLLGLDSDTRSTPPWREQFEAARENDECLARVRRWSDEGARSGMLIDILRGEIVGGRN